MSVEEVKKGLINYALRRASDGFKSTKNPLFVWECIRFCHSAKVASPDWVMEYLAGCASDVLAIDSAKDKFHSQIATAVKLVKTRGGRSWFKMYADANRRGEASIMLEGLRSRSKNQAARSRNNEKIRRQLNAAQARKWCNWNNEFYKERSSAEINEMVADFCKFEPDTVRGLATKGSNKVRTTTPKKQLD